MKKLLVILILCSLMVTAGCGMSNRPTLVDSAQEREFRIAQIDDFQMRMFTDDWDRLWLRNTNSKLTYWNVYVGY